MPRTKNVSRLPRGDAISVVTDILADTTAVEFLKRIGAEGSDSDEDAGSGQNHDDDHVDDHHPQHSDDEDVVERGDEDENGDDRNGFLEPLKVNRDIADFNPVERMFAWLPSSNREQVSLQSA